MTYSITNTDGALSVMISSEVIDARELSAKLVKKIQTEKLSLIRFVLDGDDWSSRTLAAIRIVDEVIRKEGAVSDYSNLPAGASKILTISQPTVEADKEDNQEPKADVLTLVGEQTLAVLNEAQEVFKFLLQSLRALKQMIRGKAQYQKSDLLSFIHAVGPQALAIVGLVNLLLGVILAFMGAVQLQQFGAQLYVANLVSLGLTREIAPMMTAIILAGRTGAAYAAQLGTMQVNEEIDALQTFGFSPIEFLVLPRMVALAIMTPILVLFADAIGIFGGYLVGVLLLDIGGVEYATQTRNAIDLGDIALGVAKGSFYGVLVAVTGCMQGMRSGRSASAVGNAATSAVVSGIVAIIFATAFFAVLTNALGI